MTFFRVSGDVEEPHVLRGRCGPEVQRAVFGDFLVAVSFQGEVLVGWLLDRCLLFCFLLLLLLSLLSLLL